MFVRVASSLIRFVYLQNVFICIFLAIRSRGSSAWCESSYLSYLGYFGYLRWIPAVGRVAKVAKLVKVAKVAKVAKVEQATRLHQLCQRIRPAWAIANGALPYNTKSNTKYNTKYYTKCNTM